MGNLSVGELIFGGILSVLILIGFSAIVIWISKKFSTIKIGKWITIEKEQKTNCTQCRNSEKFVRFMLTYQMELDLLHEQHIETIDEIQTIQFKTKMRDQMAKFEKTLDLLRDRIMAMFLELLKKHKGDNINALDMLEYRNFEGIVLLCLSRIKAMLRNMMTENHLSELTEVDASAWRRSGVELILSEAVRGFHKYYPAEFTTPPINEICLEFDKNKNEISFLIDSALEGSRIIALTFDNRIKLLKENYNKKKSEFQSKWRNNINEIFQTDIEFKGGKQ